MSILDSIDRNDEGFMLRPSQWNRDVAAAIAKEEGIEELAPQHWAIIELCRTQAAETGASPTLRQITSNTGISTKDLFALFPKGPAKKVAKISGIGKPEGCV